MCDPDAAASAGAVQARRTNCASGVHPARRLGVMLMALDVDLAERAAATVIAESLLPLRLFSSSGTARTALTAEPFSAG
jgi:hypothetical protein